MIFSANSSFYRYRLYGDREPDLEPEPSSQAFLDSVSIIKQLTFHIAETYVECDPSYEFSLRLTRELTKQTEQLLNEGRDNGDNDLLLNVKDVITSPDGEVYEVLDLIKAGNFGQVVKCRNSSGQLCAAKVLKNKPAVYNQGLVEVKILQTLNQQYDPIDEKHIVCMLDYFVHKNHLVIIFEILSLNIFELIKRNNWRGLSVSLIRVFTQQVLKAL